MNHRHKARTLHQPIQTWLFVGILLFATLAVPAIAMLTRSMVGDVALGGGAEAGALERVGGSTAGVLTVDAPSLCKPSLLGADSLGPSRHCQLVHH